MDAETFEALLAFACIVGGLFLAFFCVLVLVDTHGDEQ